MSCTKVVATIAVFLIASMFSTVLGIYAEPQDEDRTDLISSKVLLDYDREEIYADQVIVGFAEDFDFSTIPEFGARNGLQTLRLYPNLKEAVFGISRSDLDKAMFQIAKDPSVRYVSPNGFYKMSYVPNDSYWGNQWGPKKIKAPDAWNLTKGNSSVVVAILDTGVDYLHEDLSANMWKNPSEDGGAEGVDDDVNGYVDDLYGWNFVNDTKYIMDDNDRRPDDTPDDIYHGTHVSGIVAAVINNSKGIAGLAQVKIMAVKVLARNGTGWMSWIASGIKYAYENGADIISMSLGGSLGSSSVKQQAENAWNNGTLLTAASGNDGTSGVSYPAKYDTVIAVGATNSGDSRAGFSNYGNELELVAPGVNIISCRRQTPPGPGSPYYQYMDGTSQAAPHVSGVAALMFSRYPSYTNMQARLILRNTSVDLGDPGKDIYYGYGRVNAYEALLPQNNDDQAQEITTLGDDKYSFDVNTENFGIVAIKSVSHWLNYPYYLDLYDTPTYSTSLAQTTSYPDDDVAFIAIDGHQLSGNQTYYYWVRHQESGEKYILETENGSISPMPVLSVAAPTTSVMNSTEIIDAFQIQLQTGITYDIGMSVTSSADLDLYAACGDVVTDEDATRSITRSGTAIERLVFAARSNRWCIVVVTNPFKGVSEYTITVDTLPEDEGVSTNLYFGSNAASFPEFAMEVNQQHIGVVAIKSITHEGSDPWYLMIYDNPNYLTPLAYGEAYPNDDVAFIVVDGHLLGSNTTYYPQVFHSTQGHSFAIEMENGSLSGVPEIAPATVRAGDFSSNELFDAYQIYLEEDVMYDIWLNVPAGYDFDLFVICQDLASDNYSFGSVSPSTGADERVIFATNRTGYCAIIVTNPLGGATNYLLGVDYYEEDDGVLAYLLRGSATASSRELVVDVDTSHYAIVGIKSVSHLSNYGYTLDLYDNPNYISSLAHTESYPDYDFSFIAVDGNRLATPATYHPKVDNMAPGYLYHLEIENGSLSGVLDLTFGVPSSGSFTSSELLDAYQIQLQTGLAYDVGLDVPIGADFDLYAACGSIVTDEDSVASNSTFAGVNERLIFAATESAHCLILAVNKFSGSGTYTLTVDVYPEDTGVATHLIYGPATASSEELAIDVIPDHYGLIAIKSVSYYGTSSYDLSLYDNPNYVSSLASTQSYPANDVAFLTMDGHGLPSRTTFYPKVTHPAYGYEFNLEMENGTATGIVDIDVGTPQSGGFTSTEIVDGFQVNLSAGVSYNISLNVPLGFDYDLYLVRGQYRSEEDFDASSVTRTAGADEFIVFVPSIDGSYLIVVTNPLSGSSLYTLAVSTADLSVVDTDVVFSNPNPMEGETVQIGATIRNLGSLNVTSANLRFYDNDPAYNDQIGSAQPISNLVVGNFVYFEVDWDTTNLAGNHTVFAVLSDIDPPDAYDGNNMATRSIEVLPTPQNEKPTISILSPTPGEEVAGEITIQGVASDLDGTVQYVEVKIDIGAWTRANGTNSWNYTWNTTFYTNGAHLVYARAFDGLVFSDVASVGVTVNNTGGVVNVPPEAVVLNAPTNITDHSMRLSWSQSNDSDFAMYELYQSETSGLLGTRIAYVTDRLITWQFAAGLIESTTYYFTVRVIDTGGLYNDSNQVNGTTLLSNLPPTPVILQNPSNITAHTMLLTWSENTDPDFAYYEIYRSQISGITGMLIETISARNMTSYVAAGLNATETYYFLIRVYDTGGLFSDSNQVSGTTLPENSPPAPVTLNPPTDITETTMTLTWSQSMAADFARYEIYQSETPLVLGNLIEILSSQFSTLYVAIGLSPSTTYHFTVRVVDTGGLYADSNQMSGTTLPPNVEPSAVSLSDPTNITSTSMTLSWTENVDTDFARYEIYRSTVMGPIGTRIALIGDRSQTSYIASGLSGSTTYYFTVRVVDTGGLYADSMQVSGTTLPSNVEPTPVILDPPSNVTGSTLVLNWSQNSDPDFARYEIYQSTTLGAVGTMIDDVPFRTQTTYTVTGLTQLTTYYFTVRVVDTGSLYSDSNQVSATTTEGNTPPSAVILSSPTDITDTSVTLEWTRNLDADFALYEIYVSLIGGQTGTLVASIPDRDTLSYVVTGLLSETSYYFTVRVVDNLRLYSDSSQVSATTLPANSPPQAVSLNDPTDITTNSMTLTWSESTDSDFARYEIYISTISGQIGFLATIVSSRITTSVVISGLLPIMTYHFTVRVVDTGLLYSDSNQVSGTTLPLNQAPTPVDLSNPTDVTNNSLRLSWSMNLDDDFATYDIFTSTSAGSPGSSIAILTARNQTSYIVTGLYQNTNYYFTIRVTDIGGLFSDSNQVTAKTLPNNDPPTPVLLYDPINIADYSLTLMWSRNSDSDFARYEIYKSNGTDELGTLAANITVQSVTEYTFFNLEPETTYYFVVRVVDAVLQASNSNQVSATTLRASASVEDDLDNDGLPDYWEEEYFSDLREGALGDPDGDGLPNIVEYHDGTDPTVPDERREPGFLDQYLWIIMLILALIFLLGMIYAYSGNKRLRKQISREKAARRALVAKHKRELKRLQPLLIPEIEVGVPPPPPGTTPGAPDRVEKVRKAPSTKVVPRKKVTPKEKPARVKPKPKKVSSIPKKKVPPPPED
ncbi:MAG: fibronectin type III domain-containing protein [Thermoplasmata archaeon]